MKKMGICILLASLLLSGCSLFSGSYVHTVPHNMESSSPHSDNMTAGSYQELRRNIQSLVTSGADSGVIYLTDYDSSAIERNLSTAVRFVLNSDPVGAYAAESISYEIGTNAAVPAVALTVTYRHTASEIAGITYVADMAGASECIHTALDEAASHAVLRVEAYEDTDFEQLVQEYARYSPQTVMETPKVTTEIYGTGKSRVVSLSFSYENSRDALQHMQEQVQPVFSSAGLYVSGEDSDRRKIEMLYGFLMDRFDYTVETSITPAYSLLRHGVGDSRAFASVYAAFCRQAGIECMMVTGTCQGEPWTWNIVCDSGVYYHVDLLHCCANGIFREMKDSDMSGYVWDYSSYPECGAAAASAAENSGS